MNRMEWSRHLHILALFSLALGCSALCACGDDGDPSNENISPDPPTAQLRVSTENISVGQAIILDGSESVDPDGYIDQYIFQVNEEDPLLISTSPRLTTSFTEVGDFTVTLTVVDNGGTKNTARVIVSVR